ncbi:MAG: hemin-degrading factor [Deltaproteobacteria bacterium]|nr:MAG: hemin-degrading factor [Pseudomonadota bacterium]PIE66402.1 MAG: hemin-degrading factor [Deltaproteobacteria bacterium]
MTETDARRSQQAQRLVERYAALRRDGPIAQHQAARRLGVSEAALVAAHVGTRARRLQTGRFCDLMGGLEAAGKLRAFSRGPSVTIENDGVYRKVSGNEHVAQVLGEGIDLRLFLRRWRYAYALTDRDEERPSLQIFDQRGDAVHKVFVTEESDTAAFSKLCDAFAAEDQRPGEDIAARDSPGPKPPAPKPSDAKRAPDRAAFLEAWGALEDPHDFVFLLRDHGVSRTQALKLASPEWTRSVPPETYRAVIERAAAQELCLMFFVYGPGVLQIHSDVPGQLTENGAWVELRDPGFGLSIHDPSVAEAWLVRKPGPNGVIHSLELFDAAGETMALMFSKRRPNQPEPTGWRELLRALDLID